MADHHILSNEPARHLPGLDAEVTPLIGLGLGLTGLALGLRPRLAPLPLALTAIAVALYRDPKRTTPAEPHTLFATADGTILAIDEIYEHRFIHSDCVRIATIMSLLDVPVLRSPAAGLVRYVQQVEGDYRTVAVLEAAETNERTYVGLETRWGPLLLVLIAGPLARRMACQAVVGDHIEAGARFGTMRFGARTDLIVQRDAVNTLVSPGQRVGAGVTRLAEVTTP